MARTGCRRPVLSGKAKLLLKDRTAGADKADLVLWRWSRGARTDAADFGDPGATDQYAVCIYDATGSSLLFVANAPAGGACGTKPCWKALGKPPASKGFRYRDKERTPDGLLKVRLKPGADGKAKIILKGKGENLSVSPQGLPALPLPLPVTVQLQAGNGECWGATYSTALVNGPTTFKAKSD